MMSNLFIRGTLYFTFPVIFLGCSSGFQDLAQERLILENGLVDIPIIAGSKITENCGSIGDTLEGVSSHGCIEFPKASEGVNGQDWDSDYTQELRKNGWNWAGGESIAYYFEKPIDEDCSHHLTMLGWFQATAEQESAYSETGSLEGIENFVFIFALQNEPVCGDKRNAE